MKSRPVDLVNFVIDAVTNKSKNNNIQIEGDYRIDTRRNNLCVILKDRNCFKQIVHDDLSVDVIEISNDLYLGVNMSFKREVKESITKLEQTYLEFNDLSLMFFHKDVIVCKAEWANVEDNEPRHPQPHWHFEKEIKTDAELEDEKYEQDFAALLAAEEAENATGFEGELRQETNTTNQNDNFNIGRMHFAICAEWYKGINAENVIAPEKNKIINWISSCVENIIIEHDFKYSGVQPN